MALSRSECRQEAERLAKKSEKINTSPALALRFATLSVAYATMAIDEGRDPKPYYGSTGPN